MDAVSLSKLLCRDLVRVVAHRGGRSFLVTNFVYPDGDAVNVYVMQEGGRTFLSDLGTTLFKCAVQRTVMSEAWDARVTAICRTHGIEREDAVLRKTLVRETVGVDCLRFCQAITQVSSLGYEHDAHDRSRLPAQVEELLQREVLPIRRLDRRWTHPVYDRNGDFPVDFRINGSGEPRNVFHVASSAKSTLVVAVSSFLKLHEAYVPTLAVVDPGLTLGRHHLSRLQIAATEIRFGVTGYEHEIVQFALSGRDVDPLKRTGS